jgi:hypothetical protein
MRQLLHVSFSPQVLLQDIYPNEVYLGASSNRNDGLLRAICSVIPIKAVSISSVSVIHGHQNSVLFSLFASSGASYANGDHRAESFVVYSKLKVVRAIGRVLGLHYLFACNILQSSEVCFYNVAPSYILLLLICRALRKHVIFQLEDTYNKNYFQRIIQSTCFFIGNGSFLAPSFNVATAARLKSYVVIPVALSQVSLGSLARGFDCDKWNTSEFKIIYGGSIEASTGLLILRNALLAIDDLLAKESFAGFRPMNRIELYLTGTTASMERVLDLESPHTCTLLKLTKMGCLPRPTYYSLLAKTHFVLSLKAPQTYYGETTFPSKVVEACTFSNCVVGYQLSSVMALLGNDGGYYLPDVTEETLVDFLMSILAGHEDYSKVALRGFASVVHEQASSLQALKELFASL